MRLCQNRDAFNDDGDIVSEYAYVQGVGNIGIDGSGAGINPYFGENGVPTISMSNNLLTHHNFENTRGWEPMGNVSVSTVTDPAFAKFGRQCICVESANSENSGAGVVATQGSCTFTKKYASIDKELSGKNRYA